jgi:hypothetical protein
VGHRGAAVAAHRHLDALGAMPPDGFVDGAAAGHESGAQREVLAFDLVRGQHLYQRRLRLERTRHD